MNRLDFGTQIRMGRKSQNSRNSTYLWITKNILDKNEKFFEQNILILFHKLNFHLNGEFRGANEDFESKSDD